jgi:glycosyltransferase involved in cell wall biosynthesis
MFQNSEKNSLKIALVHDFLREYGGAERVLETLHEMFPSAPVYVAFLDKQALGAHWSRFKDWDIHQTWFAKIPLHKKFYSPLRFLAPRAFQSLDLSEFDIIISSSNAFEAKAVKTKNNNHLCYCHTPPRALYGYSTMSDWKKNPVIKFCGNIINHYMRVVDFKHAQQVDQFVANSQETKHRIKKFYKRDSQVICPPVNLPLSTSTLLKIKQDSAQDYYFYVGRLGLQKHPELAVQACNSLGVKLKVAGTGQMLEDLKAIASDKIEFLGAVSDEQLAELYAGAKALLFPVEDEDFGIVPVEAMLAGTPVIAHRSGGPQYTVQDKVNGILFDDLTVAGLVKAIKRFEKTNKNFIPEKIQNSAQKYSQENFMEQINSLCKKMIVATH